MEENFAFQEEGDGGLSHPHKPSVSAAHLREQVLALGFCGTLQLFDHHCGGKFCLVSDLLEKMGSVGVVLTSEAS